MSIKVNVNYCKNINYCYSMDNCFVKASKSYKKYYKLAKEVL